jgi:23S rRNA pseudouridine1911/1915/1917 synthase
MRLDQLVASKFSLSRRASREAVRRGRVDVDGATVSEPGLAVSPEASIELHADRPARRTVRTRLTVLYEDSDVLVVDKPAGLLTVPTEAREKDTLWTRAIHYLQHRYGGRPYAGIVHRLDRETSGALVFARNRAALHALQDLFRRHAIEREYVALVEGAPPERGTFDRDLTRTPGLRRTVARTGETGKRAVTRYETLERLGGASYVSVRPETGRTHQIRVHFAAAGHPIVGDRVYGPPQAGPPAAAPAARHLLHARRLGFVHPRSGAPVEVESPLPADFRDALDTLRRRAPHAPTRPARPAKPAPLPEETRAEARRNPRPLRPQKKAPARPALSKTRGKKG